MDPATSPAEPTQAANTADVVPVAIRQPKHSLHRWTALAALLAVAPLGASAYLHPYLFTSQIFDSPRTALNDPSAFVRLARIRETTIFATGVEILGTPKDTWPAGRNRDAVVIETTIKAAAAQPVETSWEDRLLEHFREDKDHDPRPIELRDRFLREAGGPCRRNTTNLVSGGAVAAPTALTRSAFQLLAALDPCEATMFGEFRSTVLPYDFPYSLRTGVRHVYGVTARPRPGISVDGSQWLERNAITLEGLHNAVAGTLSAAAADDVRSIAIAYIGGVGHPNGEVGVYDAILGASFEHAAKGGYPSSIYVGTYADVVEKRSIRADAIRTAWQKLASGSAIRPEFADAPWRLGSIIALFAVLRIRPRTRIIRVYAAIVVIGAGLAGLVGRASTWLGSTGVSPPTGVILSVLLAAIAGMLLPELATNDPKAELKTNGRQS